MFSSKLHRTLSLGLLTLALIACSNSDNKKSTNSDSSFTLNFKAVVGDLEVNCNDIYTGLGPNGEYSIGVGDLRFYVSNLKFYNSSNDEIEASIDDNDFQLNHSAGSVSLIDFSSKTSGFCEEAQLGTPRTNTKITGTSSDHTIAAISFEVGVPQAVMKAIIADSNTLTDAPSPLAEMTWGWANGYRHIDFNFTAMNATTTSVIENSGLHIGSKDCGTANKALSDQDACGLLYTPKVWLSNFDPANNTVTFDIAALLANTSDSDFSSDVNFGMLCHSKKSESACASVFPNLGLDLDSGLANSTTNSVFGME